MRSFTVLSWLALFCYANAEEQTETTEDLVKKLLASNSQDVVLQKMIDKLDDPDTQERLMKRAVDRLKRHGFDLDDTTLGKGTEMLVQPKPVAPAAHMTPRAAMPVKRSDLRSMLLAGAAGLLLSSQQAPTAAQQVMPKMPQSQLRVGPSSAADGKLLQAEERILEAAEKVEKKELAIVKAEEEMTKELNQSPSVIEIEKKLKAEEKYLKEEIKEQDAELKKIKAEEKKLGIEPAALVALTPEVFSFSVTAMISAFTGSALAFVLFNLYHRRALPRAEKPLLM